MPAAASSSLGRRAVVIGASLGGLLAARILAERFDEVVLLERDALADVPGPRKGTPHAVHPHGLLARGREVLEELFPGFTAALVGRGAHTGDLGTTVGFDADGHRLAQVEAGHVGLGASRPAIEAELRLRVLAIGNVRAMTGVDVREPVFDLGARRVVGVRCAPRDAAETVVDADFVVDCSGRASRAPQWLRSWGFAAPTEERVDVGVCYVSAHFRRDGAHALGSGIDASAVICAATPALPRPGVLIAQEPAEEGGVPRWVVGVGGYAGDHPEASLDGMRERARQIGSPEILKLTQDGELIGGVMRYVYAHSLRRRYERLARFPARFVPMGDALASFNPIYGQGMTVAACQALALRDALAPGLDGAHRRFLKAAARVIDTPWQLAVGADLALDGVPGPRPLSVRLVNAYVARLRRAARHDPAVALAFLRVVHLVAAPRTLFAPGIVWRVWKAGGEGASALRPARA